MVGDSGPVEDDISRGAEATLSALRAAIEAQEAQVRQLRSRKAAREQLLASVRDTLEATRPEALHDIDAAAQEILANLAETSNVADGAETQADSSAAADTTVPIFTDAMEAQLAAVSLPHEEWLAKDEAEVERKAHRKKRRNRRRKAAEGPAAHVDPASGQLLSRDKHNEDTTVLTLKGQTEREQLFAMLDSLINLPPPDPTSSADGGLPDWLRSEEEEEAKGKLSSSPEVMEPKADLMTEAEAASKVPPETLMGKEEGEEEVYSDDFED